MSAPANTEVKGGKRARNHGHGLTGVAGASIIEELVALFGKAGAGQQLEHWDGRVMRRGD
jgi:hypothetical protein